MKTNATECCLQFPEHNKTEDCCAHHPATPAGPVQPTPRPEGETACEVCLRPFAKSYSEASPAATSQFCGRKFTGGSISHEAVVALGGICYSLGYARLRAEAADRTKQIEALTGRLAYCVDLAAQPTPRPEGEEGSDAEHVSGLVRSGDSVGVDRVGADGPPANLLPQGEVARPEGETVDELVVCDSVFEGESPHKRRYSCTNPRAATATVRPDGLGDEIARWSAADKKLRPGEMAFELARLRAEAAALREKLVLLEEGKARGHKINEKQKAQIAERDAEVAAQTARVAELEQRAGKGVLCEVEQHASRIQHGTADNERLRDERVEALKIVEDLEQQWNEAVKDYTDTLKSRIATEKQLAEVTRERDEARELWIREAEYGLRCALCRWRFEDNEKPHPTTCPLGYIEGVRDAAIARADKAEAQLAAQAKYCKTLVEALHGATDLIMQITAIEAALARSAVTNAALRAEVLQREGEVSNLRAKINRQDAETSETYAELKAVEKNLRELLGLARDYIDPEVVTKHERHALLTRIEGALVGTPIGLVAARGPTPHFDDLLELAKVIAADPTCRHSSHARSVLFPAPAPAPTPAPQATTQTPPPVAKPVVPIEPGTIFRHYKTRNLYRKLFETARVLQGNGVGMGGHHVMNVTITTDGPDDQKQAQLYITPSQFGGLVCRIGEAHGWRYVDYFGVVYIALDGDSVGTVFFRSKEQFDGMAVIEDCPEHGTRCDVQRFQEQARRDGTLSAAQIAHVGSTRNR